MRSKRIAAGLLGEPARSYHRERRIMRLEFKASLMSDTKWRKLFAAVERLRLGLPVCRIKWIDAEVPLDLPTPRERDLHPARPYVDSVFGPFALCSIEWLEFPRIVMRACDHLDTPLAPVTQDVDRAEQVLRRVALPSAEHPGEPAHCGTCPIAAPRSGRQQSLRFLACPLNLIQRAPGPMSASPSQRACAQSHQA